jgi:hypothetical protein
MKGLIYLLFYCFPFQQDRVQQEYWKESDSVNFKGGVTGAITDFAATASIT